MKNINSIYFLLTALLVSTAAFSQKGYINLNVGYGLSMASQKIGSNLSSNSETIVKGTFGKGLNVGGTIGRKIKDNFAIELGVNYIVASKYKLTINSAYYSPETIELKARMLKLIPALKLYAGTKGLFYAKVGLAVNVRSRIFVDDTYYTGFDKIHSVEVYSGGLSCGLHTALGVEKMTSANVGFFAELSATAISWSPKQSEYTVFEVNGQDQLSFMNVNEKQFDYYSTLNASTTASPGTPTPVLRNYYSFSNIGLSVGVKFVFGKKKESKPATT